MVPLLLLGGAICCGSEQEAELIATAALVMVRSTQVVVKTVQCAMGLSVIFPEMSAGKKTIPSR